MIDYDTSILSKFTKYLFSKSIVIKRGLSLGNGILNHLKNFELKEKKYQIYDENDFSHKLIKFLDIPKIDFVFWENVSKIEIKLQTKLLKQMLNNKDSLLLFDCTDNSIEGLKSIINQL